jgi:hypothetical protein
MPETPLGIYRRLWQKPNLGAHKRQSLHDENADSSAVKRPIYLQIWAAFGRRTSMIGKC